MADGSFLAVGGARYEIKGKQGDILDGYSSLMRVHPWNSRIDSIAMIRTASMEYRPDNASTYALVLGETEPITIRTSGMFAFDAVEDELRVDVYEAGAVSSNAVEPAPSMRLIRSIRAQAPRIPWNAETRKAYIEPTVLTFEGRSPKSEQDAYRTHMDSIKSPEFQPVLQNLLLDSAGNIWLELYAPPGHRVREFARQRGVDAEQGPSRWVVFTQSGELPGSVIMPERLDVYEISDLHVLGLWHDNLGVESVRKYKIEKRTRQ